MKVKLILILISLLGFATTVFGIENCEFNILRTTTPMLVLKTQNSVCLEDYFEIRNMGFYSQGENPNGMPVIFKDLNSIQFHEYIVFETPALALEQEGRLKLIRDIYSGFLSSLKNEYGSCELQMKDSNIVLDIDQFEFFVREEGGQPGSRLMLTRNTDFTSWQMLCPNVEGKKIVTKSGDYIFIFIDVYENIKTNPEIKGHLAQFLFSLN